MPKWRLSVGNSSKMTQQSANVETVYPQQLPVGHGSQITPLIDAREKCCQKHTLASGQGVQDWMTRAQSSSWRHSAQQSPNFFKKIRSTIRQPTGLYRSARREGSGGAGAPLDLNDFRPGGRAPAGEAGGKKSQKYYCNNNTNNLMMMMMMMMFSLTTIIMIL